MLKKTPLYQSHLTCNAKMAEFAGYEMPIQYPQGVMVEHNWTRSNAGIFDVSHMGQLILEGEDVLEFLEKLTPSSYGPLRTNKCKYSVLMNEEGGIIDDLIVTKISDTKFFLVVNGACKDKDIAWMNKHLPDNVTMTHLEDRALIALQGPRSETVLKEALDIDGSGLDYMSYMEFGPCYVFRLGYTGEDGFEISMPADDAEEGWKRLLAHEDVKPIGLAARDSLRQEMAYPLYGHDIDDTTSPVEADLVWIMGKKNNKSFIGASRVLDELENGTSRKRVGIEVTGKGIARENTPILSENGEKIGVLTSGTFSPTLQKAVGQGYIESSFTETGTKVALEVRGRTIEAKVGDFPFVEAKTKAAQKKKAA